MDRTVAMMLEYDSKKEFLKIRKDSFWNMGSLIVLAVSGIVLNILIACNYGPAILGVFNQVFAVYILASQFAAGGLYFSTVKFVSEHSLDKYSREKIVSTAVLLCALIALCVCCVLYLLSGPIGYLLQSNGVSLGILCVLPGLWFFAINKIMLAAINGMEHMRAYAFAQSLRYILIVGFIAGMTVFSFSGFLLPLAFSAAEAILSGFTLFYFFSRNQFIAPKYLIPWIKKHLRFASDAFLGGLLTDLNTRVDVLMLGFFLGDKYVGIYSFAAMLAEGFLQVPVAILVCVNPKLSQYVSQKRWKDLQSIVAKTKLLIIPVMALLGGAAVLAFPSVIRLLGARGGFSESFMVFAVLTAGIVVSSGYLPFQMLLNQADHPRVYTVFMLSFVSTNIVLNAVMIPSYGIYGAAFATAISFVASMFYLKFFVRKTLRIRI